MSNLAMAYQMKKKNSQCSGPECQGCSSAQCMAEGGEAKKESSPDDKYWDGSFKLPHHSHRKKVEAEAVAKQKAREAEKMAASKRRMDPVYKAEGGEVSDDDLVMRIMKKRYAEGGTVEPVADFEPNDFDEMDLEPAPEFHETGANSGDELGNEAEEEDQKDMVSKIMKSRKKKDKLPRPA